MKTVGAQLVELANQISGMHPVDYNLFRNNVSFKTYPFDELTDVLQRIEGFNCADILRRLRYARTQSARLFFVGNGGSAAIASHMASDWSKVGGFAALCFNDAASLTSLANDIGYDQVFRIPLAKHARPGDVLVAISSSGNSRNIHTAVRWAFDSGLFVITLSGFEPNNPLRQMGQVNIYIPSKRYGIVEVAHHAVLHAILDEIAA